MARVPRTSRVVCTQENYEAIIQYTRNKVFEYKSREDVIDIFRKLGVLKHTDSVHTINELFTKLTDHKVLRVKYSRELSREPTYKFSGLEDKWHVRPAGKGSRVPEYLQYDSGPEAEFGNFLSSAWT